MSWLDPDEVPTLGDWFRAGGYQTHYRGKWHISHADLPIPGTHEGLAASDDDGRLIPEAIEAYREADRLDPFGFSGWIGREPHGAAKSDCGTVRDGVFAEQVVDLFGDLAEASGDGPWLAVALVREPPRHRLRRRLLRTAAAASPSTTTPCPTSPRRRRRPTRSSGRPACQEHVQEPLAADGRAPASRQRLPPPLLLPAQAGRSGRSAASSTPSTRRAWPTTPSSCSPPTTATCSARTAACSRSGRNAYDESLGCPMLVKGPGVSSTSGGISAPTSHVDLIPTLMGLAGIDVEQAAAGVARTSHRGPAPARP